MSRSHTPHLDTTQHLLVYALQMHRVPRKTAIRLVHQFSEAHVLRQLLYYVYECGHAPKVTTDWRWLSARIRHDVPPPASYPIKLPD
jgi:hypothetical protein